MNAGSAGRPFWPAYVWAATLLALFGGFLLGGLIFLLRAVGSRDAEWQAAAAQAHGRVQIFGWGGLMVLGVGLHFIPRLLSARLEHPRWPWWILVLMTSGLVLRLLAQPAVAAGSPHALRLVAAGGTVISATLLLVAAALVMLLVTAMFRVTGISVTRAPQLSARLLILTAFGSFVTALAVDWIASVRAAVGLRPLVAPRFDGVVTLLGLTGFLVAISLAMSARLFPLYVQTKLPREAWMRLSAVSLIGALLLRVIGTALDHPMLAGLGEALQCLALVAAVVGLRLFEPRRQLPRRRVRISTDALQLHVLSAYLWLLAAALLVGLRATATLGYAGSATASDAERHALGAGFVTLLILGVGSEMLPGLAQTRLRWPALRWATLLLANAAAFTRVVPVLEHAAGTGADRLQSTAGLLGALAIAMFLVNLPLPSRGKSGPEAVNRDLA